MHLQKCRYYEDSKNSPLSTCSYVYAILNLGQVRLPTGSMTAGTTWSEEVKLEENLVNEPRRQGQRR